MPATHREEHRLLRILPVRMTVEVDGERLRVRLPGLLRPLSHSVGLDDVDSVEVGDGIVMRPFGIWGLFSGFGIRIAAGFGRIYNVGYLRGIRVRLNNGQQLVIGSSSPERLAAAIERPSTG